ncbi:hypothetical protein NPIL_280691 [Nephila pilipes]|uniref:Uncharacterized protein n=1 Tax=Nephila pilipes TaxID=299642 RepID=A0A8X6J8R3_NEPPI|nr:hypothetical protein NPIL_280691 [Nephila pilipes]
MGLTINPSPFRTFNETVRLICGIPRTRGCKNLSGLLNERGNYPCKDQFVRLLVLPLGWSRFRGVQSLPRKFPFFCGCNVPNCRVSLLIPFIPVFYFTLRRDYFQRCDWSAP